MGDHNPGSPEGARIHHRTGWHITVSPFPPFSGLPILKWHWTVEQGDTNIRWNEACVFYEKQQDRKG